MSNSQEALQVKVSFPGIAIVLPHIKSGRLRALGVTSAKRASALPDVPSISEAGLKGYDATLWLGIAAPKGTPRAITGTLHDAIVKVLKTPELQQSYLSSGTEISYSDTPEQFGAFMKSELVKWAKIVKVSGATVN